MKLYIKLALDGIRKNRRLYIPYILIGSVMVMMHYIMSALSTTPMLSHFKGGGMLRTLLPLGVWIVALFAAIFLLYCSSVIIRQRSRELGLFSVLGMNRKNLTLLMLLENLLTALLSLCGGLLLGAALEKLAEAGMVRLIGEEVTYTLRIDGASIARTLLVFGCIDLILLLRATFIAWRATPLQLLHAAAVGEKPPKANWLLSLLGVGLLAWAYVLAVTIKQPVEALTTFFLAVALVIAATYLLFISGSVALCRLLQKNKRYYYKANHFVSVATLVYRMKRNGAGLASICILLTVVLVMISSVLSLYIGAEDSLMAQYPRDVAIEASIHSLEQITADDFASRRALLNTLVPDQQNVRDYIRGTVNGMFTSEGIIIDPHTLADITLLDTASIGTLTVIAQADYERITGQALSLADDECLLLCSGMDYSAPTFTLQGSQTLRVRQVLPDEAHLSDSSLSMYPGVTLITPDFDGIIAHLTPSIDPTASGLFVTLHWCYNFDTPATAEMQLSLYDLLMNHMRELAFPRETGGFSYSLSIREMERISFYGTYGGLFFIGILLSIVFISAAVLIIYYKQLSEGYEDQQRFSIMQKVGMTQKEIRRSINSQVLTVFFAPLLMAGLHLAFAFPIVWKLLQLFYLSNKGLMIAVTACSFAIFGALYALIYKVTSNTYYAIVSGAQEKQ